MAEAETEKTNWVRDVLAVPLIVGLLLAVAAYVLPKLLEKGKELTYAIDTPTSYVNPMAMSGVTISVNGSLVSNLYGYKVQIRNTGGVALSNLPVQLRFATTSPDFKILNVKHDTKPAFEFGKIDTQDVNAASKRFVYELLNPNDEDTITLVTNVEERLELYAKAEGLRVKALELDEQSWFRRYAVLISGLVAVIASLLTSALKVLGSRQHIWPLN